MRIRVDVSDVSKAEVTIIAIEIIPQVSIDDGVYENLADFFL